MTLQEIEVNEKDRMGTQKFTEAFEGQKDSGGTEEPDTDPLAGLSAGERALREANVVFVNSPQSNDQFITAGPLDVENDPDLKNVNPSSIRIVPQSPEMLSPGRHVRFSDGSRVALPANVSTAEGLAALTHPETGEAFVSAEVKSQPAGDAAAMGAGETTTGGSSKRSKK